MKKTLLIGALFLVGMSGAFAQISYGVKAGVNLANFTLSDDAQDAIDTWAPGADPKSLTGFNAGLFVNAMLAENFSVQPELFYSAQGSTLLDGDQGTLKQKMDYLSLPVLAKYRLWEGLHLEAGPQLGLLLSSKSILDPDNGEKQETDTKEDFKSIDFGVAGGASYHLPMGLGFFARYYAGMTDIGEDTDNNDDFSAKHGVFSLGASYSF